MVICNFFLKGMCRFGENCKNEHSYNENTSSILHKKPDVDINVLLRATSNDMLKSEKGNQWPLSCYGPFQTKPCFPGFEDKCFEEIRLGYYEAERNRTLEQYKQQLTQLLQETRMKIKSLQNPTPEATNMLKELYYSTSYSQNNLYGSQNVFSNDLVANSTSKQNSIFGNKAEQASIFGNQSTQNSIFGNKTDTHSNSIFGNPLKTNAAVSNFTFALPENKSIFGNNQNMNQSQVIQPGSSIFSNPLNQSFMGAVVTNQSIFGVNTAPQPVQNFNTIVRPVQNFNTTNAQPIQNFNTNNQTIQNFNAAPQPVQNFNANSIFSQNTQLNPTSHTQNIFGTATPISVSTNPPVFGANPFNIQNNQIFSAPFARADEPQQSTTSFFNTVDKPVQTHSENIFGNNFSTKSIETHTAKSDDPSIYSQVTELSESDLNHFQAACFSFGNIPSKAPPLQMC